MFILFIIYASAHCKMSVAVIILNKEFLVIGCRIPPELKPLVGFSLYMWMEAFETTFITLLLF